MTLQTLAKKLKNLKEPIQNPLLKWLYLHLPPQPITNRKMHRAYTTAVSVLLKERVLGMLTRSAQTAITKYLKAVTPFIEEYEKEEFSIGGATPEEILSYLMEQNNLTQYDLAPDLGGQPVVSDILRGKRKLTREHIEHLKYAISEEIEVLHLNNF